MSAARLALAAGCALDLCRGRHDRCWPPAWDAPALPDKVEVLAGRLSQAPTVTQAAKDILRAGLPLLAVDDPEVAKDVKKVAKGEPLSPILLVRGDLARVPP